MKLTLNKDDAGLYVAFALFGAGVGLIAGSVISSVVRNYKKRTELEIIMEPPLEIEGDDAAPIYLETTPINMRKPREPYVSEEEPEDPELAELLAKYTPTKIQVGMYKAGAVTIEKLTMMLEEAGDDDVGPVSYGSVYAPSDADKPELEDLTRPKDLIFEEAIDGRYLIHSDASALQTDVVHIFYYQSASDSFWAKSAYGNLTQVDMMDVYIDSEPALKSLLGTLREEGGLISVFAEDLKDWCAYQFEWYTEDLEEVESGQVNS